MRHGTILELKESSGNYLIRWDDEESSNAVEVNPEEDNHLLAPTYHQKDGSQLIVYKEPDRFVEVSVEQTKRSVKETSRHLVKSVEQGKTNEWWVDLNGFNHCNVVGKFSASHFDSEMQKYRMSLKAKHSLIWTVTSERADCLEGPVPRLANESGDELQFWPQVFDLLAEEGQRQGSQIILKGLLIVGQPGSGKSCVLCKIVMQCLGRSKMLIPLHINVSDLGEKLTKAESTKGRGRARAGAAGQDASNEFATDDGESLIDWYLRACYGDDTGRYFMLTQALQSHRLLLLFDGLDEAGRHLPRLERCITALVAHDHRVVATARLQDSAADSSPRNKKKQQEKRRVKEDFNRVIPSWLRTAPDIFKVAELMPFNRKDRKCMVEVLMGREPGITAEETESSETFVDDFMDMLEEDERRKWNTPLMVAMLVASCRERLRQQKLEKDAANKDDKQWSRRSVRRTTAKVIEIKEDPDEKANAAVDIQGIYTVALDLLLRRFQSRLQADRHKMKEMVGKFKTLLEVIATSMTRQRTKVFTEEDVLPLLEENHIEEQVWKDLAEAIKDGRVPLLVAEREEMEDGEEEVAQSPHSPNGGSPHGTHGSPKKEKAKGKEVTRYLFAYGSFQRFLSKPDRSTPTPGGPSSVSDAPTAETSRQKKLASSHFGQGADGATQEKDTASAASQPTTSTNGANGDSSRERPVASQAERGRPTKEKRVSVSDPVAEKPSATGRSLSPCMPPLAGREEIMTGRRRAATDAGALIRAVSEDRMPGTPRSTCSAVTPRSEHRRQTCGASFGAERRRPSFSNCRLSGGDLPEWITPEVPELKLARKSVVAGEILEVTACFRDSPRTMPPLSNQFCRPAQAPAMPIMPPPPPTLSR